MYNKALSLYFIPPFEQFPAFFSEYKQDFSLMVTLFSKVILTTEEVLTATIKLSQPLQK